jgi:very-short-patch-repair endonuclease
VPQPQLWVYEHGRPVFRVDLGYPRSRVVVEYDGREFHDSPEQRQHDRERRKWLAQRGWKVIVVDKDSFSPEALSAWLDELRMALRLAA